MEQLHITLSQDFFVGLFKENKEDAFAKLVEEILNQVLLSESEEQIGAAPYERNDARTDSRNGYRERSMNLRIGHITLKVPRHRDEPFKTTLFSNYQRNEQALITTMMEMVVQGVATRNVQKVTQELCGMKFSKATVSDLCRSLMIPVEEFRKRPLEGPYPFVFLDAIYLKDRTDGHGSSRAFMTALAINSDGHKEILGFGAYDREGTDTWKDFLEGLKERGLSGVDIITSDAHKGLVSAIQETFPEVPWQRCQTHLKRDIMDKVKKKDREILSMRMRDMFNASTIEESRRLRDAIIDEYSDTSPEAMEILDQGFDDASVVMDIPMVYRKFVRTTNAIERENLEIRKRQHVIGVFPNTDSMVRLIGSLLMDDHQDWAKRSRSFSMDEYFVKRSSFKGRLVSSAA